jgi:adenosylhomocysteine nucleosidase
MLGVICAIPDELECCLSMMIKPIVKKIYIWNVYVGDIYGIKIALIMSGMGKVNSALAVSVLKEYFNAGQILSYGTAGILNDKLKIGDLIISNELCYHDCIHPKDIQNNDTTNFMSQTFMTDSSVVTCFIDSISGKLPLLPEVIFKKTGNKYPCLMMGKIVTGDIPSNSNKQAGILRSELSGDCVDMDGAGVAHACEAMNIPYIAVRIMSDNAEEQAYIYILRYIKHLYGYTKSILPIMISGFHDIFKV